MRSPTLSRYLFRECSNAWAAVTMVLLAILLSAYFARFLGKTAKGDLPQELLMSVVTLTSMRFLVVLIPVSLLLAIMLSLGRLYNDSEMTAMSACGIGLELLYRPFLALAACLAAITAALSFWFSPIAGQHVDRLIGEARASINTGIFESGRFNRLPDLNGVFYVEESRPGGAAMKNVFLYVRDQDVTSLITAASGVKEPGASGDALVFRNGHRYDTVAGSAAVRHMRFREHGVRIPQPDFIYRAHKRSLIPTAELMQSDAPHDAAELQWRLSAPISVLLLALLAVPLAHSNPRQGRYSKVLFGILIYLVYYNLLGVAKVWVEDGKLPATLGLWWVHGLIAAGTLWLVLLRQGFTWRPARRAELADATPDTP